MGRKRSRPSKSRKKASSPGVAWATLTWDDLEMWAGNRSVARGRAYQRGGRVKDLNILPDGALLATVEGGERYATWVALTPRKDRPLLQSKCTCPVGFDGCKHAVAVVADYLQAIAEECEVPPTDEDDSRLAKLEGRLSDEVDDWDPDEEEDVEPSRQARKPRATAGSIDWSAKIERHIRSKSPSELADLAWSLVQRFPELYQEFREQISLQEGDVSQHVARTRREIRQVTAEMPWSNSWTGEGSIPDYSRIKRRLERLLDLGHADEVVSLGREFLQKGLRQVGESHDEGETATALAESLPVVFEAVSRSRMSAPERVLYVLEAIEADDYGILGEQVEIILDSATPADWAVVADTLSQRLQETFPQNPSGAERFSDSTYQRNHLTRWIGEALEHAGRGAELRALYETEARATNSYERLVKYLMEQGQLDDAERWAREGIAATSERLPGIASHLAAVLGELARSRKQWDVIAAHAAHAFFDSYPSEKAFHELLTAARKARVEEPVRAAALRFLETGSRPYHAAIAGKSGSRSTRTRPTEQERRAARRQAVVSPQPPPPAAPPPAAQPRLRIDSSWPLPVPDYLVPLICRPKGYGEEPRPRFEILVEIAIAAKRPDEVLHWFEKLRAQPQTGFYHAASDYANRVAEAVSAAYPERALKIYKDGLNSQLPHANQSAYENATDYLRKLRPIYEALGRSSEWTEMVSSIREAYRNRPRFLEVLDRLDGRTIAQAAKSRRK